MCLAFRKTSSQCVASAGDVPLDMMKTKNKLIRLETVAVEPSDAGFVSPASLALAAMAPAIARTPAHVEGELLVQFSGSSGADGRAKALAAVGGSVIEVIRGEGSAFDSTDAPLLRVRINSGLPTDRAIEVLTRQPGVKFAELDYIVSVDATSNDPRFTGGDLWGMRGDSSGSAYGTGVDEAWAAGFTGTTTTVQGVIDSGIDYRHPDLYLNIWLNQGEIPVALRTSLTDTDNDQLITFRDLNHTANRPYVSDLNKNGYIDAGDLLNDRRWEDGADTDINGYRDDLIGWDFVNNDNDPLDDNKHGTHVAGILGGIGGNGIGVAGVNWSTQMIGLKFLSSSGAGATSNAIKAIDYYTAMSKVAPLASDFFGTNNSWGGGAFSQSVLDAIIRSAEAGNLFVAAAGNGGSDGIGDNNDVSASYPSSYSTAAALGWDAVVAVASITSSGVLSSFSNYGNVRVDLAAPGSGIFSTLPGGGYGSLSGTSMATPHVMGALALIASAMPGAAPEELLAILQECVTYKIDLESKLAWDGWLDLGKLSAVLAANGVNPLPPAVLSLSFSDTALKAGESATVTVVFSEAVSGFAKGDVNFSTTAGTLSDFSTSDNLTWRAQLTPTTDTEAQSVTLSVTEGSYTSLDGTRPGTTFTSAAFSVDTKAPTVTITLSDTQLTIGETAVVTFRFSENVSGFTVDDVAAQGGALSSFAQVSGSSWTAVFTPTANLQSSVNSLSIGSGSYTDAAGNTGPGGVSGNYSINTSTAPAAGVYGTDRSDMLVGTSGGEIISGVPITSTLLGAGTIDTLTGGSGNDLFILGANGVIYYDDKNAKNSGTKDFARINDYTVGQDVIQLASGKTYLYSATTLSGANGLAIYVDTNGNNALDTRTDEMVGFIVGIASASSLSLSLS